MRYVFGTSRCHIDVRADLQEMRELFHPGIISSLRFLTDDMGNRRGTAMVRLQSRAQAEEAIRNVSITCGAS